MSHAPGSAREPLCNAFDDCGRGEWWQQFETPQEAMKALGQLWNCTDVAPASLISDAVEWVESVGLDVDGLRPGSSYAQVVRNLKPALEKRIASR